MVPETSANMDIRLYECEEFPLKWKLNKIIMSGVSAADTMIFENEGIWWLFTSIDPINAGDNSSSLHIYYATNPLSEHWTPHPQNPIYVDSRRARNGGILYHDGAAYRVAQRQGFDMYGKQISINKILQLSKTHYEEKTVAQIAPNFFKNLRGTHHLHCDGEVTVYDYVKLARQYD
jgi:hypothetical protein